MTSRKTSPPLSHTPRRLRGETRETRRVMAAAVNLTPDGLLVIEGGQGRDRIRGGAAVDVLFGRADAWEELVDRDGGLVRSRVVDVASLFGRRDDWSTERIERGLGSSPGPRSQFTSVSWTSVRYRFPER